MNREGWNEANFSRWFGIRRFECCRIFADKGYQVFLSSNDKAKMSLTREGKTPFFEPELERALSAR
jgi:UDP-glucose 6-dehydrogenase